MATRAYDFPTLPMATLQSVDAEALMAAHRRNVETMASAGQILADGARTFTQRQTEIMQARMSEFAARAETLVKTEKLDQDAVASRIDEAKSAYEQALNDARELMEIVTKAQSEAVHMVNNCIMANLEDMKRFTS